MRIIAKRTLKEFREKHKDSEQSLKARYSECSYSRYKTPNEIIQQYPKASIINNDRVVFRIKGNHYRIVTKINYHYQIMRIRFVGTHSEYDTINATTI